VRLSDDAKKKVQQDESAATLPDITDWLLPTGTLIHGLQSTSALSSPSDGSESTVTPPYAINQMVPMSPEDVADMESAVTPNTPPPRPVQYVCKSAIAMCNTLLATG
jgi:hypothetical protein